MWRPALAALALLAVLHVAHAQLTSNITQCFTPLCGVCAEYDECVWCAVYSESELLSERCVVRDSVGGPTSPPPTACQDLVATDSDASFVLTSTVCALGPPKTNPDVFLMRLSNTPAVNDSAVVASDIAVAITSTAQANGDTRTYSSENVIITSYDTSVAESNVTAQSGVFVVFELFDQRGSDVWSEFKSTDAAAYMADICETGTFGAFSLLTIEPTDCSFSPRLGPKPSSGDNNADLHPGAAVVIAILACVIGLCCAVALGFFAYSLCWYAKRDRAMPMPPARAPQYV